jgi:Tol biopolymer transport system component
VNARSFLSFVVLLGIALFLCVACGGSHKRAKPPSRLLHGTIGVSYEGELLLLAADGAGQQRIDFGADWAGGAALSPDGRRVVFDTTSGIFTASLAGAVEAKLVPGLPMAFRRPSFDVSWAPDGRSIVFAGEDGIYRADLSKKGGAVRLLFRDRSASEPKWSSNGSLIAFVRGRSSRPEGRSIWLVAADGGRPRFLVHGDSPAFSPNGARIAFTGADGVYRLRIAGGRPLLLAYGGYQPVWSPRGGAVAFKHATENCNQAGCHERVWIARSSHRMVSALEQEFFSSGNLTWTNSALPETSVSVSLPDE